MSNGLQELAKVIGDYQRRQLAHRMITLASAGVFGAGMVILGVMIGG